MVVIKALSQQTLRKQYLVGKTGKLEAQMKIENKHND